jgi:hypothetical protein
MDDREGNRSLCATGCSVRVILPIALRSNTGPNHPPKRIASLSGSLNSTWLSTLLWPSGLLLTASLDEAVDCFQRSESPARSTECLKRILRPQCPSPTCRNADALAGLPARHVLGNVPQRDHRLLFPVDHDGPRLAWGVQRSSHPLRSSNALLPRPHDWSEPAFPFSPAFMFNSSARNNPPPVPRPPLRGGTACYPSRFTGSYLARQGTHLSERACDNRITSTCFVPSPIVACRNDCST